jgi:uncharacterized protein YdgA (DUF945 family)
MESVLYKDDALYDWWFKFVLALPVLAVVSISFFTSRTDALSIILIVLAAALVGLAFWFIMPRKYFVLEDRLRVKLGGPFSMNVKYDNIKSVRELNFSSAAFGLNFATSMDTPIEVKVKKGLNFNFSPTNRGLFLKQLNEAIYQWKTHNKTR